MPRLPADIRISLKKRGGKTRRIEVIGRVARVLEPGRRSGKRSDRSTIAAQLIGVSCAFGTPLQEAVPPAIYLVMGQFGAFDRNPKRERGTEPNSSLTFRVTEAIHNTHAVCQTDPLPSIRRA